MRRLLDRGQHGDHDQRFGNPAGTRVEDTESGAETGFSLRYDTLSAEQRLAAAVDGAGLQHARQGASSVTPCNSKASPGSFV